MINEPMRLAATLDKSTKSRGAELLIERGAVHDDKDRVVRKTNDELVPSFFGVAVFASRGQRGSRIVAIEARFRKKKRTKSYYDEIVTHYRMSQALRFTRSK